jgi:hypothetical protein
MTMPERVRVAGQHRGYDAYEAEAISMDPIESEQPHQFALRIATADPLTRKDDRTVFSFVMGLPELASLVTVVFYVAEQAGVGRQLDNELEATMKRFVGMVQLRLVEEEPDHGQPS